MQVLDYSSPRQLPKGAGFSSVDFLDEKDVRNTISSLDWDTNDALHIVNLLGSIHSAPAVSLQGGKIIAHEWLSWRDVQAANVDTVFNSCRLFAESALENRRSVKIVNVSSVVARGNAGQVAYASSKAAVQAMSRSLAKELGPLGIPVYCLELGFIDTESMRANVSQEKIDSIVKATPVRRLGTVSDIGKALDFLFENDFMCGEVLTLAGGYRP